VQRQARSRANLKRLGERVGAGSSQPYYVSALDGSIVSWSPGAVDTPPTLPSRARTHDVTLVDEAGKPVGVLHLLDETAEVPGLYFG